MTRTSEPADVVTATSTRPAAWTGVVAVMVVEDRTVTPVAATPPKVTLVAPVRLVPLIATEVPPEVVPVFGVTSFMLGCETGAEHTIVTGLRKVLELTVIESPLVLRAV